MVATHHKVALKRKTNLPIKAKAALQNDHDFTYIFFRKIKVQKSSNALGIAE